MKKSIKLLLPFILFLCISNTAMVQSDATFEEAMDFVVNNMMKERYDNFKFHYSLKYSSNYILNFTTNYEEEKSGGQEKHIYNRVETWSLSDISEVKIGTNGNLCYINLKCHSEQGECVERLRKFIRKTDFHYKGKHIKEEEIYFNETKKLNSVSFYVEGKEEMAQRVKKALDHARKLAGAKDEKF